MNMSLKTEYIDTNAVVSDVYRQRLASHMAGRTTIKPIAFIAFGDGGHNPDNTRKLSPESATSLYHEVMRKPVSAIEQDDLFSTKGKAVFDASEIPFGVISEVAMLDEDGQFICWKTFPPKYLESGEKYGVALKLVI